MKTPAALAWRTIALANGWLEPDSRLAASPSTSSLSCALKATRSVTRGLPSVRVPVLSNATVHIRPMVSKALPRSEEHTSELQSRGHLVCRLLLEKKKTQ